MSSSRQEWLERHHASFATPADVVVDIVVRACGVAPDHIERIVDGELNEVLAVQAGAHDLIVRIFHGKGGRFLREAAVIERCRAAGLPVPDMVLAEAAVCVERRLPGTSLSRLAPRLDEVAMYSQAVAAGRLLGQLATASSEGLERTRFLDDEWAGGLDRRIERLMKSPDLLSQVGLDRARLDRVGALLRSVASEFDTLPVGIVHGDYHPKHLLIEDSAIVGLIDLESGGAGPVVYDVAWWDYFVVAGFPTAALLDGLEQVSPALVPHDRSIHLARLRLAPMMIHYFAEQSRPGVLDFVARRLHEDLEFLGAV